MELRNLKQPFVEETGGDLERQKTTKLCLGFYTSCHHHRGECFTLFAAVYGFGKRLWETACYRHVRSSWNISANYYHCMVNELDWWNRGVYTGFRACAKTFSSQHHTKVFTTVLFIRWVKPSLCFSIAATPWLQFSNYSVVEHLKSSSKERVALQITVEPLEGYDCVFVVFKGFLCRIPWFSSVHSSSVPACSRT